MVVTSAVYADGGAVDTMTLTDEPGNWFKARSLERLSPPFARVKEWISKSTIVVPPLGIPSHC